MLPSIRGCVGNRLLDALPPEELREMSADLQYSTRAAGAMLVEPHKPIEAVHFPTDAVVVLIHKMEDGSTSNVAVVGNEGVVGVSGFMSDEPSPVGAVVQVGGGAISMRVNVLRFHFARGGETQRLLLSYTQRLIEQISQTAACRRQHRITQHVASWLLMTHDRAASRELLITQNDLADILGVRRESVSQAARSLLAAGCIGYVRGHIRILDRSQLAFASCECYRP